MNSKLNKIASSLASALGYIHLNNIVHCDLKLENILLKEKGNPYSLKIIDFGISSFLSKVGGETIKAGTLLYSPPEVISKQRLNVHPKIDVWSLGVIFYILLTKEFPFCEETEFETYKSILKDKLKFPKSIELSKEIRHLLSRMLDKDPDTRYSISDVQTHPWLSDKFKEIQDCKIFKETIEDKSEFYDSNVSGKKLTRSGLFSKTRTRRASILKDMVKGRRVSSHPSQIARRISKLGFDFNIESLNEAIDKIKDEDDSYYIINRTQLLGSELEKVQEKRHENLGNIETIEIPNQRNAKHSKNTKSADVTICCKTGDKAKNLIKSLTRHNFKDKQAKLLLMDRKFCFNEPKLK